MTIALEAGSLHMRSNVLKFHCVWYMQKIADVFFWLQKNMYKRRLNAFVLETPAPTDP